MRTLIAPAGFDIRMIDLQVEPCQTQTACLSAAERERVARFAFERDRRRFRAAHCGLRRLLSERTGIAPAELNFVSGPHGKPALSGSGGCAFNMSHSDDVAVVGIAAQGESIGIDIESCRPLSDALALARRHFSRSELHQLEATDPLDRSLAFLRCWTRKEACLKAIGSGLSIEAASFSAGFDSEPRRVTIGTANGLATLRLWSLEASAAFVGAFATVVGKTQP